MEIKEHMKEDINVFELIGRLDVNTSPMVQTKIMENVLPDCKIIMDMSGCDYVSSAGLRVLLVIAKQLAKVSGQGVLIGLLEEVKDVMEMTGFDNIFQSYEGFEAAAVALKEGA